MSDLASPPLPRPKRSETRKAKGRRSAGRTFTASRAKGGQPRWRRRVVIGAGALVALAVLVVGGGYLYAWWRFNQIHKKQVAGLVHKIGNAPFDVLLVGSDSRAFVDTAQQAAQFGNKAAQGGQRSDVIIIARIVPATRQVKLLSIPRDTYVNIPGHVPYISGANRINVAFDSGPGLLVQTLKATFHIPVTYYAEVNFPGFAGMVDALGGVGLNFPYPLEDPYSQLKITTTGCQVVHGAQALALVRSRHLSYFKNGAWQADGMSDWSRIQRQDAFFRAVISKLKGATTNPVAMNNFLGAATKNITIDQTLSEGEIISLARIFRSFTSSELQTETLPTVPYTTSSGAAVLLPAPGPDEKMLSSFLAFGSTTRTGAAGATATPAKTSALVQHLAPGVEAVLTATTSSGSLTPVTTLPGSVATNPANVVYNTQPEPWNPTPCTP